MSRASPTRWGWLPAGRTAADDPEVRPWASRPAVAGPTTSQPLRSCSKLQLRTRFPNAAGREAQGRTSGSSAAVRPAGSQPQRVGLALLKVVPAARRGSRYVALAWVRSTPPGLKVTLRLAATGAGGGEGEASQAVTTTLPGDRWDRVTVAHKIAAAEASLDLQITAAEVEPGAALLIDEVELRRG